MKKNNSEKRKIDYSVRDTSHTNGQKKVESSGILIFSALLVVGFLIFLFFLFAPQKIEEKYVIGHEYLRKIAPEKKFKIFNNPDDSFYKVKIIYDTEEKNGFLIDKKIYVLRFIKMKFDISLRMKTLSLYDYFNRISDLKNLRDNNNASFWKSYGILEKLGFDKEDFVNENFTEFYIYLEKKTSRDLESLKPDIIRVLRECIKNFKGRMIVDFNEYPEGITKPDRIKKRSGFLVIE